MRSYKEAIHKIAMAQFSDEMGGGYGTVYGRDMVAFIYEVPYEGVVKDVVKEYKIIRDGYYAKLKEKK